MSDKAVMKREIRCISQYNSILITRYVIFAGLILGSIWFYPVTLYILVFYLVMPHILKFSLSGSRTGIETTDSTICELPLCSKKEQASSQKTPVCLTSLYKKYRYDADMHRYQSLSASLAGFCLLIWGLRLSWPQVLFPLILLAGNILLRQIVYWFYRIRIHFMLIYNSL